MKFQYKPASLGVACVQCQTAIHFGGDDLGERFEEIFLLFCRDTCSRIGYDELMGVRATFLEVEADTSLLRIESGIFQQVEQDTFQLFFIRFYFFNILTFL